MSTPTVPDVPPPLVDHPRYKIVGRLGEGGMGVVYKAEHRVMGRTVALKVLSLETITSHPAAVDRFRREVHLASRLSHPNIVTAYDADEAGGLHFLVMEYVDGLSLDRVVHDQGPLPVPMACTMIRQAAIGLQHAHEKGMVHRDIKPHNLMVTKTGEVKILDFGLARVATADGVDPASLTAMAITKPQTLMGTPDFLSPEQARSSVALDIRSDLYSLGCTLYYLLAGKPPFGGVGAYAKMIAHFKEPAPQLREVRPDASPELGHILQKLMAKSPDDRYQTPTEVAAALLPFAGDNLDGTNAEANGQFHPRESWLKDAKAEACEETQPSYATDPSCPILPMASEFEASIAAAPALPLSQEVIPEQPKPTRKRSGRMFSLAVLVVLGVSLGGIAKWLTHTHEQTAQAEAPEVAKQSGTEPGSTLPQTPKTEPASQPISPPIPQPKPIPKPPVTAPQATSPTPPVTLIRKKHVLLLIPPEYAYNELKTVSDAFKSKDAIVLTASAEKKLVDGYRYGKGDKTYVGSHLPDYALKDLTSAFIDSIDAVILLPGETSTFTLRALVGTDFKKVIEKAIQKKKVIGAIGSGVFVLGSHGFLEHAEVSSMQSRPVSVAQLKVKAWKDDPKVVVDLPFITAGEFSHSKALVEEIIKAISDHR